MKWIGLAHQGESLRSDAIKKTKKTARGRDASGRKPSKLDQVRLNNEIKHKSLCAVCGKSPSNEARMRFLQVACWSIMACERHQEIDWRVTISGTVRFFEKIPE